MVSSFNLLLNFKANIYSQDIWKLYLFQFPHDGAKSDHPLSYNYSDQQRNVNLWCSCQFHRNQHQGTGGGIYYIPSLYINILPLLFFFSSNTFSCQYFFANFFNRDLTYELMTQLWGQTMEKLLFSVNSNTNATTVLSPPPLPSDTYQKLFPNEDFSKPTIVDSNTSTTSYTNSNSSGSTATASPLSATMAASPEISRFYLVDQFEVHEVKNVLTSPLFFIYFPYTFFFVLPNKVGKHHTSSIEAKKSFEFHTYKPFSTSLDSILQKCLNMVPFPLLLQIELRLDEQCLFNAIEITCSILLDGAYFRMNLYLSATFLYFTSVKEPIILGIIPFGKSGTQHHNCLRIITDGIFPQKLIL